MLNSETKKVEAMTQKIISLGIILIVTTILISTCQTEPPFECLDTLGCIQIAPEAPLKIGVIQALSGGPARLGITQLRTVELVVTQRGNEILGHPVEFVIEDELCSAEGGTTAALKVAADQQIIGIIGTTCSGAAATASKIISEAGMAMISGGNSAPSLTSIAGKQGADWYPGYYRTALNDSQRGQAAAEFVFTKLGIKRAATLNDGDTFTQGLTAVFEQEFIALGGEIVTAITINKGDTDMFPFLEAIANAQAEFLFFALFQPEADQLVIQAVQTPEMSEIGMMSAGLFLDSFLEAIGEAGQGMYFIGLTPVESSNSAAIYDVYEGQFGELPFGDSFVSGYDAVTLLIDAIEAVVVQDKDGTLHIGRQALRNHIYSTSDYEGVSGALKCDAFGDCGAGSFSIFRLDDPSLGVEGLRQNLIFP
jgi:branched-chain amino acid transport system substrate-binding protein